ncbi:MAG TPA: Ig-like domain-containing protein [Myxococcota bacterium]|nr:Ig-like domain-containing protein [Myxococcota bacterium]
MRRLALGLALAAGAAGCARHKAVGFELFFPSASALAATDHVDLYVTQYPVGCGDLGGGADPGAVDGVWRAGDASASVTVRVGRGAVLARGYDAPGNFILGACTNFDGEGDYRLWLQLLPPFSATRLANAGGAGQLVAPGGVTPEALAALVTDANGAPVAGVALALQVEGGGVAVDLVDPGAGPNPAVVTTGADGVARVQLTLAADFTAPAIVLSGAAVDGTNLIGAPLRIAVVPDRAACVAGSLACAAGAVTCTLGAAAVTVQTCGTGACAATGAACEGFSPTGLGDASVLGLAAGGAPLVLPATSDVVFDTDTGAITTTSGTTLRAAGAGALLGGVWFDLVAPPPAGAPWPAVAMWVFDGALIVPAGVTVRFTGAGVPAIVASGDLTIDGTIDVSGATGAGGGCTAGCGAAGAGGLAGAAEGGGAGAGVGGGGLAPLPADGDGGAGAAYGGTGGPAGVNLGEAGVPAASGPAYGTAELLPLVGGSGGGAGGEAGSGGGGGGGGAVQLVSATRVTVSASGAVRAGGGGGGGGDWDARDGGGGGGAGGAILIEAPVVSVTGALAANGGGGGGPCVEGDGASGGTGAASAAGGACAAGGTAGGAGGAGATPDGAGGGSDYRAGSGGGGGAGRIRLNGTSVSAAPGAASPAPSTGALRP